MEYERVCKTAIQKWPKIFLTFLTTENFLFRLERFLLLKVFVNNGANKNEKLSKLPFKILFAEKNPSQSNTNFKSPMCYGIFLLKCGPLPSSCSSFSYFQHFNSKYIADIGIRTVYQSCKQQMPCQTCHNNVHWSAVIWIASHFNNQLKTKTLEKPNEKVILD